MFWESCEAEAEGEAEAGGLRRGANAWAKSRHVSAEGIVERGERGR